MVSKQITKCTRKKLIWCSEHSFKIVIWGAKTHLKALTEEKLLEKKTDKNLPVRYSEQSSNSKKQILGKKKCLWNRNIIAKYYFKDDDINISLWDHI
jgi:hypothetical protein